MQDITPTSGVQVSVSHFREEKTFTEVRYAERDRITGSRINTSNRELIYYFSVNQKTVTALQKHLSDKHENKCLNSGDFLHEYFKKMRTSQI